ncbi:SDR family oxidoreductase [Saccharopolyspora tripterygii]
MLMVGCGDLGTEVGLRLAGSGRRVVGLRRNPDHLPPAIEGRAIDLSAERPDIPEDTEVVICILSAGERIGDAYQRTFVGGLHNVLDALGARRVRPRIIFVSSISVFGDADGGWVGEQTPPDPTSATAEALLDAERLLHARDRGAIVLRLAGLYGPGRDSLINQVRSGKAGIPRQPTYTNRIHRDDAASAIVHLATEVDRPEPLYIGVDDEPAERAEVLAFLAGELGVAQPPLADPSARARPNKRCRNDRLRSTAFEFEFPSYREGYRAILAGRGTRHP